ncbi:hypothetical protein [Bosea sp. NPDC055594]
MRALDPLRDGPTIRTWASADGGLDSEEKTTAFDRDSIDDQSCGDQAGCPKSLKRREAQWTATGSTRFLKGGQRELSYFKEKTRRLRVEFEVVLEQPGAHADSVTVRILQLLATTKLFLKKTTNAKFRVILNAARAD